MKTKYLLSCIAIALMTINSIGVSQSVSACGHYFFDSEETQTGLNEERYRQGQEAKKHQNLIQERALSEISWNALEEMKQQMKRESQQREKQLEEARKDRG